MQSCNPASLGIGPKDELAKHNIPRPVNMPGVGRNLMAHLSRIPAKTRPLTEI